MKQHGEADQEITPSRFHCREVGPLSGSGSDSSEVTDGAKKARQVNRDVVENAILTTVREQLLDSKRIEAMAKELQRLYQTRIEAEVGRSEQALEEGRKIEVRIERLKERLRQGGPDMVSAPK